MLVSLWSPPPVEHERRSSVTWSASQTPAPQHTVLVSCAVCREGLTPPRAASRASYSPPPGAASAFPSSSSSSSRSHPSSHRFSQGAPPSPSSSASALNAKGRHPFVRSQKSVADLVEKFDHAIELHRKRRVHVDTHDDADDDSSQESIRDVRSHSATLASSSASSAATRLGKPRAPQKLAASVGDITADSVLHKSDSPKSSLSQGRNSLCHSIYRDTPLSPRMSHPMQPLPSGTSYRPKLVQSNSTSSVGSHKQDLVTASGSQSRVPTTGSSRSLASSETVSPAKESNSGAANARIASLTIDVDAKSSDSAEASHPSHPTSPSDPMSLRGFLTLEIRSRGDSSSSSSSHTAAVAAEAGDDRFSPPVSPRAYLASLPSVLAGLDSAPPSRSTERHHSSSAGVATASKRRRYSSSICILPPPEHAEEKRPKPSEGPLQSERALHTGTSSPHTSSKPLSSHLRSHETKNSSSPQETLSSPNRSKKSAHSNRPPALRKSKSGVFSTSTKGGARSAFLQRTPSRRVLSRRRPRAPLLCKLDESFVKEVVKPFGELADVQVCRLCVCVRVCAVSFSCVQLVYEHCCQNRFCSELALF